jgi:hypothetical protein
MQYSRVLLIDNDDDDRELFLIAIKDVASKVPGACRRKETNLLGAMSFITKPNNYNDQLFTGCRGKYYPCHQKHFRLRKNRQDPGTPINAVDKTSVTSPKPLARNKFTNYFNNFI